ncbi:stalk domain-containing protein [Criibacterium bergeronii]|uniref:Copper amine oxidase-like N-terminal domain-containing protein n=1 Tax=Criibacterium bergeronii TaxID=1871336 RepID=A0A371IMU9_9FIRM|nr:stalk domain-containing protein [Criibacterium bergeronii]MBS6063081.1 hypothetical protein [Peptostreptococcaceae bacterium]RDY21808.1 hypothetical protein BBG48_002975 [Criibacterium bergeronii]
MKKIVKNASLIALGLTLGLAANSLAANLNITAIKDNTHKIFLDGTRKDADLINYENRVYVPLRFVSENMGLSIDYDKSYRTIDVKNAQVKDLKEQIEALKKQQEQTKKELEDTIAQLKAAKEANLKAKDNSTALSSASATKLSSDNPTDARKEDVKIGDVAYKQLPIYFTKDGLSLELNQIVRKDANSNSNFYIYLKNQTQSPIMIDVFSAVFTYVDARGNTRQLGHDNVLLSEQGKAVLSSFPADFDDRFYMALDQIPEDAKKGVLTFNYYKVGDEKNITRVTMAVQL